MSQKLLLLLLPAVLLSGFATAADWTEFRGPTGQGHSDAIDLPTTWSEDQNIAWKVDLPGNGWSSPVVAGGRIYLTTAVPAGNASPPLHSLRALCLSATNGQTLWNVEVFRHATDELVESHNKNSHASPTPILQGDRLYVHFGPHGTACLKTDGTIIWRNSKLVYSPQHGNGGSPAITGDLLIICCDGKDYRYVTGLNRNTGDQVWKTDRPLNPSRGFSFCTPTIVSAGGRTQAVCPGSGGVWSYDPQTGQQLWQVTYGEGYSVVPRPVVGHGLVYVSSGFGDQQLFAIDPTGSGDVTDSHVRWKTRKAVPKSPSVLLVGNELYTVDDGGIASCRDAVSGDLHWQERLSGRFSASPSLADGVIYFQDETGTTTVVQPGTEYHEVARNQLGTGETRTFASFAFVDNAILLRSETSLYRIENRDSASR